MARKSIVQIVKPPITWILIADAKQAQVYTRHRIEKIIPIDRNSKHHPFAEIITHAPLPLAGMQWEAESPKVYDVDPKQLGKVHESANPARHMTEPRIDVHDEIREHFARLVSGQLNRAEEEKRFDRLVLVAPARMLGEIKKYLNEKSLKKVVAEMHKDLTHYEGDALAEHLGGFA